MRSEQPQDPIAPTSTPDVSSMEPGAQPEPEAGQAPCSVPSATPSEDLVPNHHQVPADEGAKLPPQTITEAPQPEVASMPPTAETDSAAPHASAEKPLAPPEMAFSPIRELVPLLPSQKRGPHPASSPLSTPTPPLSTPASAAAPSPPQQIPSRPSDQPAEPQPAAELAPAQQEPSGDPAFEWLKASQEPRPASALPEAIKAAGPSQTSLLTIRPPEEEVRRRETERLRASQHHPVIPRLWQTVVAIAVPVVVLALAVRVVATGLFLWLDYHRPGFPADSGGFTTEQRMTLGSFLVDYLNNMAGPDYLRAITPGDGLLLTPAEIDHMVDVKWVYATVMVSAVVLGLLALIGLWYLVRRTVGGARRALFAGTLTTVVLVVALVTLATLAWDQFFTLFHQVFFPQGSWVFTEQSSLIRLFPQQFWVDAGITTAVLGSMGIIALLVATWPTKARRGIRRGRH